MTSLFETFVKIFDIIKILSHSKWDTTSKFPWIWPNTPTSLV